MYSVRGVATGERERCCRDIKFDFFAIVTAILFLCCIKSETANANSNTISLVSGEWAPYSSRNMESGGLATEIVAAVISDMGYTSRVNYYPWKRAEFFVEKGEAWAAFPYRSTKERSKRFHISDPIATVVHKFFYYSDDVKELYWNSLDDLKRYKLCGLLGSWYMKSFREAGLIVDSSINIESSLKMLKAGRCDILSVAELVGWYYINEQHSSDAIKFKVHEKTVGNPFSYRLLVSRSYPNSELLLKKFNQSLMRIKENGVYKKIQDKYILEE